MARVNRINISFVVLLVAVVATALSINAQPRTDGGRQKTGAVKNRETKDKVQLIAGVVKERFKAGDPITLKVVLRNNSAQECRLISRGPLKDYLLEVRTERGEPAALTPAGERLKRNRNFSISTGRSSCHPAKKLRATSG